MGRVDAFMLVTLDGYFEGPGRDISWHQHDAEGGEFALEGLKSVNTLLFGRVTYELMARYWPTSLAMSNDPTVAKGMNSADKIVFSRTMKKPEWINTRLVKGNMEEEIKKLKQTPGQNMTLLGSGSILTRLAQYGLIDEYQFMVVPVVLGKGTPIFNGLKGRLKLQLTSTRTFRNGNVLLCYQPAEHA
jgi:dihydrofolate reductase